MSAHSARTSNRREAEKIAAQAFEQLIAEHEQVMLCPEMTLISFMEIMYDEEKSPYFLEKKEHNARALQSAHLKNQKSYYNRYIKKLVQKGMVVEQITPYHIKQIQRTLLANNPSLARGTINAIMASLLCMLKYAFRNWVIPRDPTEGYTPYKPERVITGIFHTTEVDKLIALLWNSPIGKLAFILAIYTGMRMGEILALQFADLESWKSGNCFIPVVHIRHSFSKTHGLKCPKNGKSRTVPIPLWLWNELRALAGNSDDDTRFVFASARTGMPISDKILRRTLENALVQIGVSLQEQTDRNLRFHSTRHYFNSALAPLVQNESLRKVIGHSNADMTEHYHHITEIELEMVADAQSKAFKTLPFPVSEVIA